METNALFEKIASILYTLDSQTYGTIQDDFGDSLDEIKDIDGFEYKALINDSDNEFQDCGKWQCREWAIQIKNKDTGENERFYIKINERRDGDYYNGYDFEIEDISFIDKDVYEEPTIVYTFNHVSSKTGNIYEVKCGKQFNSDSDVIIAFDVDSEESFYFDTMQEFIDFV